jgi:pimeloyl-ACP methyl ester carboxylesterase
VTTTATTTAPVLVLHDVGDERGGEPWRSELDRAGWPGTVLAPDLPGHAGAPPPPGGAYELTDAVLTAVRLLGAPEGTERIRPVAVGLGVNGWAAELLALGGWARALVLVDGLGGPWRDGPGAIAAGRQWLRAIADDPTAIASASAGAGPLDPRLRHGVPPHGSRALAERAASEMPVPALLVETPASAVTASDAAALALRFRAGATVTRVIDARPETVVAAVVAWWSRHGASDQSTNS